MVLKIDLTNQNWNRISGSLVKIGLPREAILALQIIHNNSQNLPHSNPTKPLLSLSFDYTNLTDEELRDVQEVVALFSTFLPDTDRTSLLLAAQSSNLKTLAEALLNLANRTYAQEFFDWINLSNSILSDLKKAEGTILRETSSAVSQTFHHNKQQIEAQLEKSVFLSTLPISEKKALYSSLLKIKDEAEDLVQIEKIKKASFIKLGKWIADRKRYKTLKRDYIDLSHQLSALQNALNIPQGRMEEFDKLSIHAKLPRRSHLADIAYDYISSFKNLLPDPKKYQGKIDEWSRFVQTHPHIGNNNPQETLSTRKSTWTKQQKQFNKAFQPIIDEMLSILKEEGKTAADLSRARDAILQDPNRWRHPIDTKLTVPGGLDQSIQHTMTAVNPGYPSSLFRGRTGERDWILPNAHLVTLKSSEGTEMSYLSSATPVEFFASEELRTKSTETQCMEILLNGAVSTKGTTIGTFDNPRKVPFTAVSLLSPNPVVHFLLEHSAFKRISNRLISAVDASNDESRLTQELENGMRSLLAPSNEETSFQFRNANQEVTTVERTKDASGNSCFKITTPDGSEEFVAYELSLFSIGVNRIQRFMQNFKKMTRSQEHLNNQGWEALKVQKKMAVDAMEKQLNLCDLPTWAGALFPQKAEVENKRLAYLRSERSSTPSTIALKEWIAAKDRYAALLVEAQKLNEGSDYLALMHRVFDIECLTEEIEDQMEFKDYLTKEGINRNAYSLPSALMCLSSLIGNAAWTGCRSGKDRTSLQRMEIAVRLGMRLSRGRYLHYREMEEDPNTYRMREEAALNTGHYDQLAMRNIGSQGLNLRGLCSPFVKRTLQNGKIIPHKTAEVSLKGVYKAFRRKLVEKEKGD